MIKLKDFLSKDKIPKKYASDADAIIDKMTDEFDRWEQQDQNLVSWLLASMDESFRIRMVGCEYSCEIWERIEAWFLDHTRAKIKQLKVQLKNVKKGDSTMSNFLLQLKKIVDALATVRAPVDVEDHKEVVFDGLTEDYDSFITSVTSRTDPYTVQEIEALLMVQEERLEKRRKQAISIMQANVMQRKGSGGGNFQNNFQNGGNVLGRGFFNNRGGRGNRGRGRFGRGGGRWQQGKPQCQVCGKIGHVASSYYNRFNQEFPNPFLVANAVNSPPPASFHNPVHQNAHMYAYLSQQEQALFQAYLATPSTIHDPLWYPDLGASNHLTPKEQNLMAASIYGGNDKVKVGNGQGYQGDPSPRET